MYSRASHPGVTPRITCFITDSTLDRLARSVTRVEHGWHGRGPEDLDDVPLTGGAILFHPFLGIQSYRTSGYGDVWPKNSGPVV